MILIHISTARARLVAFILLCGVWSFSTSGFAAQEPTETFTEASFVRLSDSKIAEAIKLTDEQRSKVAALITSRAEAISKAALADRPGVIAQNEKDLEAILTDEQRVLFVKETVAPRLRFNFRFQKWSDVLEWYAKQSNLSLILDAPPPGTFNYSDTKSYTPVEAMDLLNGVLSTKGFTLIRRGGMLLVIDVQDGIPDGLIPRIPLEELEKRGKFELVSVMFPLGGRDAQSVKAEVTPLLSAFGKSVLLPQTKQLLVTDTAGIVRAVSAVISSIEEPAAAAVKAPPLFAVYSLKGADPKVAEEVLTKMFPGAKIAADAKAEQVNAFATPNEQEAIKGIVDQMQAQNPPDKRPRLEVYPIKDQDSAQLMANLALVAPLARITFNARERQIAAFASPLDQANLKTAIETLAASGNAESTRQMEVYRLSKADPASTLTLLQGLIPQAKLSVDPQTRRLVVVASQDDHKAIKAILDQLQSVEPGPDTQSLQFYPLDHLLPPNSVAMLSTLAPKAQIIVNAEAKQLQVLASPADQTLIKANLDELLKGVPAQERRQLTVYRVTPTQRTRFQAILPSLNTDFPDIRVTEGEPNELVIWARPAQHELLKTLIESLATDAANGEKAQLVSHPLRAADPTTATAVLKNLVPEAKISLDSVNRNLVAIGSAENHQLIKTTLEKLQPGDLGPDAPVLRFYPLEKPLPVSAVTAFTRLVPKATVTPDVDGKWLQIVATSADHALIKNHLDELLKELPAGEKRKLAVYTVTPVQKTRFQALLPSLTTDFPDVRQVVDSEPNELAIWAKPSQHELLKTLIEALVGDVKDASKLQLVLYPLRSADPTTVTAILKSQIPEAKISLDSVNRNLVAVTSAENHETIKATLEKLQPGDLGPDTPIVRFYPLENPLPAATLTIFTKIAPKASVTADVDGKWLQVIATAAEHQLIKSNLEENLKVLPPTEKRKLVNYTVTPSQRTRFQAVMPSLSADLPDIRVVPDGGLNELAIWAKPTQHVILSGILEELKREPPANERNQLVSYALKYADPTTASIVLQTLFPGVKINVDLNTSRLLIWARPADHTSIKQAIEELDGEAVSEKQEKVTVYPVAEIDPDAAITLLHGILPKVRLTKDPKARTIVAWGKKADHEIIAKTLDSMRASVTGAQKPHLKIYPAGKINAANMIEVLRVTFPNARLAVDSRTGGLAALGTAAEQDEIQSAINQMMAQAIGETGRFHTYRLFKTERETAMAILTQAAPESRITSGKDPTQLLAWARPADHVVIERIIEQLESESAPNKNFELKVYSLKSTAASNVLPILGRAIPKAMVTPSIDPSRLIIWALPGDHLLIAQIIKQFDAEHAPDTRVEFYDVQKVDSDAALRLVQAILQKQGVGSTVTLIPGTNQLYVEARPEQHEIIKTAMARLKTTAETGFEVFQLDVVDTFAADSMIRRMFSNSKTLPPIVEADGASQKLFVKGTKEQIGRIREMLDKMGETSVGASSSGTGGTSRRIRVIPFGGDPASAISEIQRIWPQLRSNELRVVPAGGVNSNLMLPQRPQIPLTPQPPSEAAPKSDSSPSPDEPDDDDDQDELSLDQEKSAADESPVASRKNAPTASLSETVADSAPNSKMTAKRNVKLVSQVEKAPSAPIVVMPKDGSITILSDDTEALDQLDKLLRALSLPTESGGRAFAVYALKYSGATSVAETVRQSLRIQSGASNSRTGFSAPTVVADERLNAIVVHANRNDRIAIEKLIETLDSSEIPESRASNRPRRVAVKHGSALQIEQVLRLVYKSQLTTGGGRKELPIPPGLPPEIAATIQQMNAANTGPLLALSVDDVTNSIVIMAPISLADQVTKLIEELDEAALTENSQGMNIVPTQRMSAIRAQKVLNLILDKSKRGTRRP